MRVYLLVLLVAAATTYVLTPVFRWLASRVGAVARVRDRDVHTMPVPYFGGIAMLGGIGAAFVVATHLPFLGSQAPVGSDAWSVFIAGSLICAIGVVDDVIELNPMSKLAGQVLASGLLVAFGVKMLYIPLSNTTIALDPFSQTALTVFFILLCTNAVNYVDGLDGLAAGVVGIGAASFFVYSYSLTVLHHLERATTPSLITVSVVGVCVGFLPHNFQPARIFMGDSGAMLLGLLLASSTISMTGQMDSSQLEGAGLIPSYLPLIVPVAALALPIVDFVLAFLRRSYRGRWWFVADRQHIHHRILERGHGMRRAVLLMYMWTAVISLGIAILGWFQSWLIAVIAATVILVLSIVTLGRPLKPRPITAKRTRFDDRPEVRAPHRQK